MITKQKLQIGMSLVELMIAMLISLFISAGLFSMFNMSSSNVTTTSQFTQLQENGRIALAIMERDISQLGFFGDITGTDLLLGTNTSVSATAVPSDCVGDGFNNATFPLNVPAHFRRLWGYEQGNSVNTLNCGAAISPISGTDVIQIKRLVGPETAVQDTNRYYASVTSNEIEFFNGSSVAPNKLNSRVWEYQHHIYFIKNDSGIPILSRKTLNISKGMNNEDQLVEGIENIRFLYGFDDDGDSTPDSFMPANEVSTMMWDNQGFQRLVAIKIYVLVRSIQEDDSYENEIVYQLGDKSIPATNDKYRRKVMSTTVVLDNPVLIRN
ncbi:pilus assembly protein PilW [Shewanella sp. UCD-FRSSP16_17]|uniref:PilW family protein n=1 Tax=unclassified Shewanella TaxID=196818 RepID=UPI0007EEB445|nr:MULTISPECIES: PilW family protein [unclassified Shewanella]MBQ4888598.1 PilW family protein [Shewanella sp. MMG014]OBT09054.1 pilus assembly protein PilW [Shewanella sp. UCD-FRSSP16_17]